MAEVGGNATALPEGPDNRLYSPRVLRDVTSSVGA